MHPAFSQANRQDQLPKDIDSVSAQSNRVISTLSQHANQIGAAHSKRLQDLAGALAGAQKTIGDSAQSGKVFSQVAEYAMDALQRMAMTVEVLRERGNNDKLHEEAGTPPVLKYAYEQIMDGRDMPHPVNYALLKILPPKGVKVSDEKRPFMIIDPRAGHGAGIGGFKVDSQVGVALRAGHPVYFVVFRQYPEPEQTLADVMRAEAEFLVEIARRHPLSPKAVVVGNCQGGWATLLLSAANPDLTGPLVINGAPVATWSGHVGENPMRYNGGLLGGILPALLISDLGDGKFDGAHLVSNFEMLNPSRNFFGKYFDLYTNPEAAKVDFLEFERWWGGFHFTNEAEIRWIIEQLFIGNRLARGDAQLEPGRHLDLKSIRAPIIVFASKGDNITPPQQALNWIVDTYADEHEIRIRGQRIIYMVHEKVGHLGIFVSSSIARKEHAEMTSTLQTIEALAPGLYEMKIDDLVGDEGNEHFVVSFHDRKLSDILTAVPNDRDQERDFAAVARLSELGAEVYEIAMRPLVQSMVTEQTAAALRDSHPSRVSRKAFSDSNPLMPLTGAVAQWAHANRKPADPGNPFLEMERIAAQGVSQTLDFWRDARDALYETAFLSIYGNPYMHWVGKSHAQERKHSESKDMRYVPEVQNILRDIEKGDIGAAVIRMLILLADSRGSVRRDRLERSAEVLNTQEPFALMGPERRGVLIYQQSLIVEFEAQRAVATLPKLLVDAKQREDAMRMVYYIVGARDEMEPQSLQMLQLMEQVLGMTPPKTAPKIAPAKAAPAKVAPAKRATAKAAPAKRTTAKATAKAEPAPVAAKKTPAKSRPRPVTATKPIPRKTSTR
jgi:pimeloyl-ACP methyl ester carboxylesterase